MTWHGLGGSAERTANPGYEGSYYGLEPLSGGQAIFVSGQGLGDGMGTGRPVDVTVSDETGEARVAVRDRGPGIPGEARERIFAKYERAARAENVGGLGLGLWMARGIAEAHGGTVTVESVPGDGAVFTLRVPKRLTVS